MELYWPGVVCLDVSSNSITTEISAEVGWLRAWEVSLFVCLFLPPCHTMQVSLGKCRGLLRARGDEGRVFHAYCVGNERWMEETA